MNNAVEGINSRVTGRRRGKWSRRQNGGSHCHKTEYRKKEKKKRRRRQPETSGTTLNTPTFTL